MAAEEDPYIWLEAVESEESLDFARGANEKTLKSLGDPTKGSTYGRVLAALESEDRIPYVVKRGLDDNGNELVFNFWSDAGNPKGIWRKCTMNSYKTKNPEWETVLDLDEMSNKDGISWVWEGSEILERDCDPNSDGGKRVTRALLRLSRGGSDAVHIKEFDFLSGDFVSENPFNLPEAKTDVSYKSRDVLIVGTDFGPDSLTDSGYPRTVREWVRGTDIKKAPIVVEGEKSDMEVAAYIDDQRRRNGPIYEVHERVITFFSSRKWVRMIEYEHLLAPDDPLREKVGNPPKFQEIQVQEDALVDFLGNLMIITLRSDWAPIPGENYIQGSLLYVDAKTFLEKGPENCSFKVLFAPSERTASANYAATKNYLIHVILDNVKSKVEFYKITSDGFVRVGKDVEPQIRDVTVYPVDSLEDDRFWLSTSSFLEPDTLQMADASLVEASDSDVENLYAIAKMKSLPSQFNSSNLIAVQGVSTSTDGTQVPYFLIKNKNVILDGKNPTLMYGYGGFEQSESPYYAAIPGIAWLERGGVYVIANIRGGGEFGAKWHQAALKKNRNKAYEDFIAVAEDLIASGYCKPLTLAIQGGSNGGLLVGNMYTMRPDLFGAIVCEVPLIDMKRFNILLAGASWMGEYGDPSTDDWDNYLHKYSPYHNIDTSVEKYPAILVTTSTRDDRVHPAHARKFVKKLWDLGMGKDWPVYYYENIEGGHGGAADAKQSAFLKSLAYDFMFETLSGNAKFL
ncbi:Uncharacterized peptidase y4nA [Seminavis robusta]|uniref:Prolyl endopeptidase n=1 Tax=Seminavis robusta TaxID=568900 RepID=A0A9N8ETR9_9STRA|nr:Uncharacterized peptidase y4nA [Seminavis robusta]|eukprot:Sro1850_g301600.1 Uncharacterized peptidase y4nA (739) ;mRNA; r:9386-11947